MQLGADWVINDDATRKPAMTLAHAGETRSITLSINPFFQPMKQPYLSNASPSLTMNDHPIWQAALPFSSNQGRYEY